MSNYTQLFPQGIAWTPVEYFDNRIICELIEKKGGILAILDEVQLFLVWLVLGGDTSTSTSVRAARTHTPPPHIRLLLVGGRWLLLVVGWLGGWAICSTCCCCCCGPCMCVCVAVLEDFNSSPPTKDCLLANATDMSFLEKLAKNVGTHKHFKSQQTEQVGCRRGPNYYLLLDIIIIIC